MSGDQDAGRLREAERKLRRAETQRQRRSGRERIDFYAAADVVEIIDGLRFASVGGDASSILNRIVREWAAASGISAVIPARAPARGADGRPQCSFSSRAGREAAENLSKPVIAEAIQADGRDLP